MCLTPVTITRDYRREADRWANAAVSVPCGICIECLRSRQAAWRFRLGKHQEQVQTSCFLTLTYDADHIPITQNGRLTLCRKDLTDFWKRLRKAVKKKAPGAKPLKYYAIGEYGGKFGRPHYHAILFNLPDYFIQRNDLVGTIWGLGLTQIDACTPASIGYVTGYVMQGRWVPDHCPDTGLVDDRIPHYSVMSQKLGWNYLTPQMAKYHVENLIGHVTLPGGQIIPLPRYFKSKLFNRQEREIIAEEMREIAELDVMKMFPDPEIHVQWKKRKILQQEKKQLLERQKL